MASMWRRAMVYLGLVDDPEDTDEGSGRGPGGPWSPGAAERSAEPAGNVRPLNRDDASSARHSPGAPARPTVVRTMPTAQTAARVHVVEPHGFNDAQEVGDRLKANQPVILNLQGLERDLQRRLIDFSSGLAYALAGSMARVADQVFLLTPSDVEVSQEEKERLQARGLYRA